MRFDPDTELRTCTVNDYSLSYLEMGAGEPVVLVHGSLCDCRYWRPQMLPLARSHRVIAVSLRHYWPQASAARDGSFAIARHADDVAALIDALGLGAAHVVGHSRGGRVALETALRRPQRVRSLVLADPGVQFADAPPDAARGRFVGQAMALIEAGDVEAGLALFVDAVNGENTWPRMVEGFKRMARDNAVTLLGQASEPAAALTTEALRALRMPALLIGGSASPARYDAVQRRLQELLPDVRRVVVQGAAHGMNLAKPHSFNSAVAGFLARVAQADTAPPSR